MTPQGRRLIQAWFQEHPDDAEFGDGGAAPYAVIAPRGTSGRVIYTTKGAPVLSAVEHEANRGDLGVVARHGLPCETDADWIRSFVADRELFFLGDMDPPDLLIYAWLREALAPKTIVHLGVSDRYLERLGVTVPASFLLDCAGSEQEAMPLMQAVFPDWAEAVGHECGQVLEHGKKIELEAVVSALGSSDKLLSPLPGPG